MGNLTHTVSGDIASFRSAARVPIESLRCHFLPIQEGTGDPSPDNVRPIRGWNNIEIYQSGLNLINLIELPYQYNSVDIECTIENNSITLSAKKDLNTFGQYTAIWSISSVLRGQEVYIGCTDVIHPEVVYYSAVVCEFRDNNNKKISDPTIIRTQNNLFRKKVLIPSNAVTAQFYFRIAQNGGTYGITTGDTVTFKEFYIRYPADIYEYNKYQGRTIPITFPTTGKNLFNFTEDSKFNNMEYINGIYQNTDVDTRTSVNYVIQQCAEDTSYIASAGTLYSSDTGRISFQFTINKINCKWIRFKHNGSKKDLALMVPWPYGLGTYTISFTTLSADPTTIGGYQIKDIQIEVGDTATEYEPYNPDNTVYGGYVDIAKGEIVKEYDSYTFTGIEDDEISYYDTNTNNTNWMHHIFRSTKLDRLPVNYSSLQSYYSIGTASIYGTGSIRIYIGTPVYQVIFQIRSDLCEGTVESFCDWLSNNPLQIVYNLREPIHYPLSKTELKTFLDQNNIWSNTNDITEVSYQIHDSNMIHNAKLAMMAHSHDLPPAYQQYDYLRTSGNNARIDTGITGDDTTLQIKCEFKFTQINNSYIGVFGNYKNENDAYCWRAILPNVSTYPEPNFLYVTAGNGTPGNGNGLSSTMLIRPCYENNTNPPILDKKIKIDMKYGSCHFISSTKDSIVTATTKTADANTNNICLGAMSTTSAGGTTQCRIYSFKLYSQNHLVRNYVPCIRKSDSKAGFYDLVNHTFNPSIGSVEFVAGNEE